MLPEQREEAGASGEEVRVGASLRKSQSQWPGLLPSLVHWLCSTTSEDGRTVPVLGVENQVSRHGSIWVSGVWQWPTEPPVAWVLSVHVLIIFPWGCYLG